MFFFFYFFLSISTNSSACLVLPQLSEARREQKVKAQDCGEEEDAQSRVQRGTSCSCGTNTLQSCNFSSVFALCFYVLSNLCNPETREPLWEAKARQSRSSLNASEAPSELGRSWERSSGREMVGETEQHLARQDVKINSTDLYLSWNL